MTNDKDIVLSAMVDAGKTAALNLRTKANDMTGTEIIDLEMNVPAFDNSKDYSDWPVGSPVSDEGQVWTLIQPYNAADHPDTRLSGLRALWGLCHTTNPEKAKPWVEPQGISGQYLKDECYLDEDGNVYICLQETTVYDHSAMPDYWKKYDPSSSTEPEEPDAPVEDEWPEFKKPEGAHDAYNTGDKITYNGKHYICKQDACVYSPDEYAQAWELQE